MTKSGPAFYTAMYWREGSNWLVELTEEPRVHTVTNGFTRSSESWPQPTGKSES